MLKQGIFLSFAGSSVTFQFEFLQLFFVLYEGGAKDGNLKMSSGALGVHDMMCFTGL